MKKLLLSLCILICLLLPAYCQNNYWQQQVDYKIDVTLNDKTHTLDGFVKIDYHNNSPDTLYYIWFHVWPNAYKNDRTAFSDQMLENGRTDFYFSTGDKHGYMNRLDFKVNGTVATTQDHPQHQDIIKLILPQPLPPKNSIKIQTPFHEQLPFNFSRGGHVNQSYQITQWYPKPAVYDSKGWHPMPYLDQGEFYSEFGNYEVQITLPKNYVVAATGQLQDAEEKAWLDKKITKPVVCKDCDATQKPQLNREVVSSSISTKTIHFLQNNIHDFAWFADKGFSVYHDTLQLASGRIINAYSYHLPKTTAQNFWAASVPFIKKAVLTRSRWLGEYPYDIISVVEAEMGFDGGMEYPTITSVSPVNSAHALESVIEHEVGHNWNYGIIATNERDHPWMDEGINTFYDGRYQNMKPNAVGSKIAKPTFFSKRIPGDLTALAFKTLAAGKKDQPIETISENFSEANYGLVAYYKTGQWMKLLEAELGKTMFDSCMHEYYRQWKFKHPYPEDFKKVMEDVSGKNLDATFNLLSKKGMLPVVTVKKDWRFSTFFNLTETDRHHYIFAAPLAGYNFYDKVMLGAIIHNYTLPAEKFQFLIAPLYATGSKQLNGLGRLSYYWFAEGSGAKAELSLAGATFSANSFTDSTGKTNYQRFAKLVPSLKIVFNNNNPRSHLLKYIQWKTFFIREQDLLFTRDTINQTDKISFPFTNRYVNQLRFVADNNRVLYPYHGELQLEQGKGFARLAFTGDYFFNYPKGGGMKVRLFAGKFFYLGDKTYLKQFETERYHLNMTGPKGYEDYTYSDYFIGRNEYEKYSSQQIMQRDGFFKVRTDLLSSKIGKTDDWLAATNLTTDFPKKFNPLQVLPVKIPLKIFLDVGTYAEAWKKNADAATGKFIYDAGLQLSLLGNTLNIYVPLLYSKVYSDYFKSAITQKRFLRNISFSIDIQNINLRKLAPQIPSY
ncbi:MAG: M1 family metallopeptidase [Aquabacterium sp.]|nr:M1 family metallopeptidase [Ferruginibacter sp.]